MRTALVGRSVAGMPDRATADVRGTYLVEHYRAGVRVEELRRSVSRVRDAVAEMEREGKQVGFRSSTIVPSDDYFLSVVEAASEQLVREAFLRAGIPFERISTAISVDKQEQR
jgi:hypothetical protein